MGSFARNAETLQLPTLKCDTAIPHESQGLGLILQLGTDYEKKKHKLQQELQLDYKNGVAKKSHLKPRESHLHYQGFSLPIKERESLKDRLRKERNKEYNLFLQEQAQKTGLKKGRSPVTSKLENIQASDVSLTSLKNTLPPPTHKHFRASRRDAATLTEARDARKHTRNLDPPRRRKWQVHEPSEFYSSEEELYTDEEEDLYFRRRRRPDRYIQEPRYYKKKRTQKSRLDRTVQDMKAMEGTDLSDQDNNDGVLESYSKQIPDRMRTAATPDTSQDEAECATGLLIGGAEDQMKIKKKKEQYRQELLKQIAEQQRNKLKEKKLDLKVAATGATDPEKEPDRIKQLRTANRQYEVMRQAAPHNSGIDLETVGMGPYPRPRDENTHYGALRGNSLMNMNTTLNQLPGRTMSGPGMTLEQAVPQFDFIHEDYHKNFTRMPGEVALPRITPVAPPLHPMVPSTYRTPYDSAPYNYSTRNPLEIQDHLHGRVPQFMNFETPPPRAYEEPPFATEGLHANTSQQKRESILRYQEALKQQIQEREKRKQREREEKERSDAKSEAERMIYDPWGKSGGGAPIKDQFGNLVSDLKQMHIINENRLFSPSGGAGSPLSHQQSGSSHQYPPQPPPIQDRYQLALKQQIEENRRKREEEQERQRIAMEQEEERLEKERARIMQQYEEEQRIQEENQNRRVHEVLVQHINEVKNSEQRKLLESRRVKGRQSTSQFPVQREQRQPSPPIPTLQKKHTNPAASKPTSERSASAPYVQPVPRPGPTHQKGQQEVIEGLSALRNYLKKEQRQVEQLGLTEETCPPHLDRWAAVTENKRDVSSVTHNRKPGRDGFEDANKESGHPLTTSPTSAHAEKQNNQLNNGDVLNDQSSHHYTRRKPARFIPRNASLPFEAFTDKHCVKLLETGQGSQGPRQLQGTNRTVPSIASEGSGDKSKDKTGGCDGQIDQQGGPQPSEERRERTASQRKQVASDFLDGREQTDLSSNHFLKSHKLKDTNQNKKRDSKSDRTGSGPKRPISVGTVETELWTRPREHQKV